MEIDEFGNILVFAVIFFFLVVLLVLVSIALQQKDVIKYEIDGTNITCTRGEYYNCGYDLWGCSDGKERECVGNVIVTKRGGK